MSAPKFPRSVYQSLMNDGHSNREIARMLGVNEASVRRALKGKTRPASAPERRFIVTVTEAD